MLVLQLYILLQRVSFFCAIFWICSFIGIYLQKCTSPDKLRTVHFFFGANRRRLSPPTSHTTYPDFMIIRNSDRILRFSVKIYQKSRDNLLHQICSSNPFRKYRSSNRLALLQRITHSSNISSLLKNGTPHSRYFSDELGVPNFLSRYRTSVC